MYSDSQLNITKQVLEYDGGGGDRAFSFSLNTPTVSAPDDFKEKRFRKGDINPSDGSIFWCYQGNGKELWLAPNDYEQRRIRKREIDRKYQRGATYRAKADRTRATQNKYRKSPHGRAKIEARRQADRLNPEWQQKRREYYKRPDVIERRKQYEQSPERREAVRRRYEFQKQDPEWRDRRRKQERRRRERMKALGIEPKRYHRKYDPEVYKQKYQQDAQYVVKARIRARVYQAIRNGRGSKQAGTEQLVGCSFDFLRQHIERQFKGSMSWDNSGSFHIDHIVPLAAFDLGDPMQLKVACNWQNLRPIPPKKNMSKGAKITEPQLPLPLTVYSTTTCTP